MALLAGSRGHHELLGTTSGGDEGAEVRFELGTLDGREGLLTVRKEDASVHFSFEPRVARESIALPIVCDEEGSFHGFGEQYNATEQTGRPSVSSCPSKGSVATAMRGSLMETDTPTCFPMPWYLTRGFGVLLETDHRVEADICASDATRAELEVVGDSRLEWRVFLGPTPADVVRQLGDIVGRPTAPPDWSFSPWMCTQGGPDAVLERLAAMQDADIPVGALWVQDWTGQRENLGGGYGVQYRWLSDTELYPDLRGSCRRCTTKTFVWWGM